MAKRRKKGHRGKKHRGVQHLGGLAVLRKRKPRRRRRGAAAMLHQRGRRRRGRHLPLRLLVERRDRLEQIIGERTARGERE